MFLASARPHRVANCVVAATFVTDNDTLVYAPGADDFARIVSLFPRADTGTIGGRPAFLLDDDAPAGLWAGEFALRE